MWRDVDPFIGTERADLPVPTGLAATWWSPKPPVGNTHPGATYPLGMVSACSYAGGYPTGYGRYDLSTEGEPRLLHPRLVASGVTHFHQSGTGAIRAYYNYVRVTPMVQPLDGLGTTWPLTDEHAEPGYYAATLASGIRLEVTVGPRSAVHRYTFPEHDDARVVLDLSHGGLAVPHGETVPRRAQVQTLDQRRAEAVVVMEGTPLALHVEVDAGDWQQVLWHDHRAVHGGTALQLDHIRATILRPFGVLWHGPAEAGRVVEVRVGFSLRGADQARANLQRDTGGARTGVFDLRRAQTATDWRADLGAVRVRTASPALRSVLATALYHSLVKPALARDESPTWAADGPYAFDLCTMWDIHRTQLPLLTALLPERAVELANALLTICEEEGNLPIGYRMAKGADRFWQQGSALAHTFLADLCRLDLPGVDWEWALSLMAGDLRRSLGEDFLLHGVAHPVTHTLDLAFGYHCTAVVARRVGDAALADRCERLAERWTNAFDPATGLLVDSTFYEGGRWNYSFRITHDMRARIELAGGEERFTSLLDRFFGYGAAPVSQPGPDPDAAELADGIALQRFQGLNNEPDLDAPWAYHYVGRPDRTAEVVQAVVRQRFGTGRGGLPGNDDSGGLSSWLVWAVLGLFPVAGQGVYLINAPVVEEARVRLGERHVVVTATGALPAWPDGPVDYVQSVTWQGRPLDRSWIPARELHRGGHLQVELGPAPSTWATGTRPPSTSLREGALT
ncbi:glycoside hydrolase domain-containing protein [Ornithinimicrobium sediminis]|uniref:glycoside hydrolase domain-containing protein n=1 Tax=Ornithinimicrobium sediminis TaxID=2904603 RepID=UPI001E639C7C|nr:glycoside hydrolase family 92 protein [Ornithinimicrobium sediminis]